MGNGKSGDLMELLKESMIMWIFKQVILRMYKRNFIVQLTIILYFVVKLKRNLKRNIKALLMSGLSQNYIKNWLLKR